MQIALRLAGEQSLPAILLESSVEEAIVALYEPQLVDSLKDTDLADNPRLAAIVAETCLRSFLVSGHVAPPPVNDLSQARRSLSNPVKWADTWAIRGSRLSKILEHAIPYAQTSPPGVQIDFPHLTVLCAARPVRRLRYELLAAGPWPPSFVVGSAVLVSALLGLLGISFPIESIIGLSGGLSAAELLRRGALHGYITLPSSRILDLQPFGREFTLSDRRRIRLITGDLRELRRLKFRRPTGSEGANCAVYDRVFPLFWKRYCPAAGDRKISRRGCASVQQMWTEDVRRLMRGVK